jgi:3-hydroxybutyrate dehydrogenase
LQGADSIIGHRNHSREHAHAEGKTALVTGSTSGIGLGMALALARSGAASCSTASATSTARWPRCASSTRRRSHDGADMSKPSRSRPWCGAAKELGSCDILVNNAGIQHVAPIEDFPVERWDAIIAINLSSAFHAMRAACPA